MYATWWNYYFTNKFCKIPVCIVNRCASSDVKEKGQLEKLEGNTSSFETPNHQTGDCIFRYLNIIIDISPRLECRVLFTHYTLFWISMATWPHDDIYHRYTLDKSQTNQSAGRWPMDHLLTCWERGKMAAIWLTAFYFCALKASYFVWKLTWFYSQWSNWPYALVQVRA